MTLPITNPETGEIWQAPVFVATLPASSYIYTEVQPSQELQHWLNGHIRAFTFFGGVPKSLRPDNLKTGVKKPNYYEPVSLSLADRNSLVRIYPALLEGSRAVIFTGVNFRFSLQ